jgi:hypothetical protein
MEELLADRGPTIPQFYSEAVENTFRSQQAGRPQFDEVEFVRLIIPGDRNSSPVMRVTDEERNRWPKEYEAFKKGLELPLEGTPLIEWPPINKSQVMELAYFHIQTVEQLAAVNDAQLQRMGMGTRALRELAKEYLDIANNGTAPIARMLAKIEALELKEKITSEALAAATARIAELEGPNAGHRP